MDPVSQGVFGGIYSQFISSKKHIIVASIVGICAGLSPDLDTFIRSSEDPLLHLEFHRQFTHSLIFIPFGALVIALLFKFIFFKNFPFAKIYIFAFIGYCTHGLLDACTSYGTQLLWPFSNERFAWNSISIIDPLFTIPTLIFLILAFSFKKKMYVMISIFWTTLYLSFGFYQNDKATNAAKNLAEFRKHNFKNLTVKPSFGNLFLWKIIYSHDDVYFVDAVNLIGKEKFCYGTSIPKLNVMIHYSGINISLKQLSDIKRFDWFSQGYLGYDKKKELITDVRYSAIPNEVDGLWGIKINKNPNYQGHVKWIVNRGNIKQRWLKFSKMLFGDSCKQLIE